MKRVFFVKLALLISVLILCAVSSSSEAANASLDEIDASNIGIKAQYKIADKDSFTGYIKYSPDGRFLLYSQRDQIVIIDVATRKIQKTFKAHYTNGFAWSPDGTRIVYCNGGNVIIHDIKSGKSTNVTYGNFVNTPELTWFKDDKIDFSMYGVLDLNSLSFTKITEDESLLVKKYREHCSGTICFAGGNIIAPRTGYLSRDYFDNFDLESNIRKSTYNTPSEGKAIPSVVVSNKDGSFTKVLVEYRGKGYLNYDISPKSDSFAYGGLEYGLYIAYLDTNFKTEKNYSVEDFQSLLSDDLKNKYKLFISRNVPIIGEVYSPRINPLTGKVIGPGMEYKGSVKITGISNGKVVVQKIFERTAFKAGVDVVSNFLAVFDKDGKKEFIEFNNIWRTLNTISEKEIETIKEEKQKQIDNAATEAKKEETVTLNVIGEYGAFTPVNLPPMEKLVGLDFTYSTRYRNSCLVSFVHDDAPQGAKFLCKDIPKEGLISKNITRVEVSSAVPGGKIPVTVKVTYIPASN